MDIGKKYSFFGGEMTPLRDDVILIEYSNQEPIIAKHIESTRDKRIELIGDTPYFAIIDMRKGFVSFTSEAKQWVAENSESAKIRQMDFLLVGNFGLRMEAILYLKFFRPKVPTKVVTSLDDALREINDFKNKAKM